MIEHAVTDATGVPAVSTFWRYLRVQAFVFLCGIVGPIFLTVYFAAQPEPGLKWMYWAGLLITVGDVLIALVITDGAQRQDEKRPKKRN
jgi:hypothetical protein